MKNIAKYIRDSKCVRNYGVRFDNFLAIPEVRKRLLSGADRNSNQEGR